MDYDKLVPELVEIWSSNGNSKFNEENVRDLINNYFLIAFKIGKNDRMPVIFDDARKFLASSGA